MTDHRQWRLTGLLGLAAIAFVPAGAVAQSAESGSRVVLLEEMSLTKVRDLDFGYILPTGTAGTVLMTPGESEASCAPTGGILHFDTCQPAVFGGEGSTAQIIRVRLPAQRRIILTGPGGQMRIDQMMVDVAHGLNRLSPAGSRRNVRYRIVDPDGVFLFRIGGLLRVAANQQAGLYEGTFTVEIDYR